LEEEGQAMQVISLIKVSEGMLRRKKVKLLTITGEGQLLPRVRGEKIGNPGNFHASIIYLVKV
jgi:hypothetical protein